MLASDSVTPRGPHRDCVPGAAGSHPSPASSCAGAAARGGGEGGAAPHRPPPRQGATGRQALRRPRSGQVPPRRPSRRQAPPPRAARCGPLFEVRPQPACRRPFGLRGLRRGAARARPPALRRALGSRSLCALRGADDRRLVPLRPARRAGGGTGIARAQERHQPKAIRTATREADLCGLRSRHRRLRPLSRLCVALQYPRSRLARRAAGAAVLHRDRAGDGDRPRHL